MENIITKDTQQRRVLDYMAENGWLTPMTALTELGIMRLSARISELDSMGVAIERGWVELTNRYGELVRVRKYRLKENNNEKQ